MNDTLKILLLAALTLLVSAQTFVNYRSLPDKLRTHIDKALKKANENFGSGSETFDNYRSLPDELRTHTDKALKKANENFGSGYHVAFHSIKELVEPMIDCVVCKTQDGEELVDCARAFQCVPVYELPNHAFKGSNETLHQAVGLWMIDTGAKRINPQQLVSQDLIRDPNSGHNAEERLCNTACGDVAKGHWFRIIHYD
ncbi:hypothetical protein C0J50_3152 [Silurus asotus]|uniref:Uncharacterized protein n=1 Tax=Silurus asotus TaxID=30991 RepID=A0AAD5B3K5_SILAS|nr:hypothetical protein C0J50_3152 [Silurus asotus]